MSGELNIAARFGRTIGYEERRKRMEYCMKLKLLMLALSWAFAACGDQAESAELTEHGSQAGRGGRDVVDLEDLLDAGEHRDSGARPSVRNEDGGDPSSLADADIPTQDGGLERDADVTVEESVPVVNANPSERGPWPVGVRTALLPLGNGHAPVEIWYPAERGSQAGKSQEVYDYIKWLPPEAQEDVPIADKPVPVICDCYRDLPIDTANGPYPAVVYAHNIAGARVSSIGIVSHWASRGFVVVALDHPKLHLQDVLSYSSLGACTASGVTEDLNHDRDVPAELAMLRAPAGDFAFLSGAIDAANMAVVGHSEGGAFAAKAGGESGVRLVMQWNATFPVTMGDDLRALAYVTGSEDGSTSGGYNASLRAFNAAALPAMLVSATDAGHLSATEMCNAKSSSGRDGLEISARYELCGVNYGLLGLAWDCSDAFLDQPTANQRFGSITAAALEHFVLGQDRSAAIAEFGGTWGIARLSTD